MRTVLVTVKVENTYVCGRESDRMAWVSPPDHDDEDLDEWYHELLDPLTGDGHKHPGARRPSEHALYEVTVLASPPRPDLVGEVFGSEG